MHTIRVSISERILDEVIPAVVFAFNMSHPDERSEVNFVLLLTEKIADAYVARFRHRPDEIVSLDGFPCEAVFRFRDIGEAILFKLKHQE